MSIKIEAFTKAAPEVYAALGAIAKTAQDAGLEGSLIELCKVRASQINGCVYCLQFHIAKAHQAGTTQAQLDQLSAWRESKLFGPRERAALAWTEKLTLIQGHHPSDADRENLAELFSEKEVVYLTVLIGHINLWNRVNIALGVEAP